jgi:hypothetical protein
MSVSAAGRPWTPWPRTKPCREKMSCVPKIDGEYVARMEAVASGARVTAAEPMRAVQAVRGGGQTGYHSSQSLIRDRHGAGAGETHAQCR